MKRILLTGIGGNTAQGVARSLLKFREEFTIIGSDSDRYNVRHGFDYSKKVYLVPPVNDESYISALSKIIKKENIDMIIPSPDPEVYEISRRRDELDVKTMLPDHRVIEVSQDKWLTCDGGPAQGGAAGRLMSAFGYKRTFHGLATMSAFGGKADIRDGISNVRL